LQFVSKQETKPRNQRRKRRPRKKDSTARENPLRLKRKGSTEDKTHESSATNKGQIYFKTVQYWTATYFNLAYENSWRPREAFELAIIIRREGDRHGEFTLDSSDRNRRGLDGGAGHEGTNLMAAENFKIDVALIVQVRFCDAE